MKTTPQARIISVNQYSEAICAGAARISTTQGNAMNIFESSKENPDAHQEGSAFWTPVRPGTRSIFPCALGCFGFRRAVLHRVPAGVFHG